MVKEEQQQQLKRFITCFKEKWVNKMPKLVSLTNSKPVAAEGGSLFPAEILKSLSFPAAAAAGNKGTVKLAGSKRNSK
jgi:hypothetical protein